MTMMLEQQPLRKKIKIENYSVDTFTSRYIPDDLLHEILIRLPNLGSAIRCSTVCKRWLSIVSRPDFTATFMDHHRSKVDLTLLFGDYFIFGSPIHISLPQRTTTLQSLPVASLVDSFRSGLDHLLLPDSNLLAMCEDLLLVRISAISDSYYVCNPLTGQIFMLPDPPEKVHGSSRYLARCGLVSEPKNNNNSNSNNNNNNKPLAGSSTRYRVMLMFYSKYNNTSYRTFFCSETWQWTQVVETPGFVSSGNHDVVASNDGLLYWMHLERKWLIALDPFKAIDDVTAWNFFKLPDVNGQLRLGLFEGRPRLSQLFRDQVDTQHLCLKVWDFKYGSNDDIGHATASFPLAYQVKIVAEDLNSTFASVLALHPSHNNQIFMLCNRNLYQYDMETKKQVKVAEIRSDKFGKMTDLRIFAFVNPAWPKLI